MPINRDHDVVWLEIAVHDAGRVSFGQPFGHILQVPQKLSQISSFAMDLLAQGIALDVLHRDEMQPINFTNLVDVRDVWMIQRGRGFRFTNETFHPVAIRSHIRRKNFQRNFAIEFRVLRQIHLAHSTLANL